MIPDVALAKLIRPRAFETSAARTMCVRPQARFPTRSRSPPLSLSLYVTKSGCTVDLGAIPGPRFTICQAAARARNRSQDNGFEGGLIEFARGMENGIALSEI